MNLLDLISQKGIQLKKAGTTKGGEWQGPCPWCGGTDRFHVWPEQNRTDKKGREMACPGKYWCRPGLGHCGRSGDAIQFLIDHEGLTFKEAAARLGQKFDRVEIQRYPRKPSADESGRAWDPAERAAPVEIWRAAAMKFALDCYDAIAEAPEALAYLAARGIREETLGVFGLGWNAGTLTKDGRRWGIFKKREAWGLLPEKDEKTGKPRPLWLPVGWVIPYLVNGQVRRLRIRQPDGVEFGPRYYMVPGSSSETMVIPPKFQSYRDVYVIVEAELDAMLVSQEASDLCGVMALGSASTRPDKSAAALLARAAHILNALDADGAGAKESWKWWHEHFPEAMRWPVPAGKDPGEAYQQGVDLREWVIAGLPPGLRIGQRRKGNEK